MQQVLKRETHLKDFTSTFFTLVVYTWLEHTERYAVEQNHEHRHTLKPRIFDENKSREKMKKKKKKSSLI